MKRLYYLIYSLWLIAIFFTMPIFINQLSVSISMATKYLWRRKYKFHFDVYFAFLWFTICLHLLNYIASYNDKLIPTFNTTMFNNYPSNREQKKKKKINPWNHTRWFVAMPFSSVAMVWSRDPCSLVALETVRWRIFYDLVVKLERVWDGLNKHVFDRLLNKLS